MALVVEIVLNGKRKQAGDRNRQTAPTKKAHVDRQFSTVDALRVRGTDLEDGLLVGQVVDADVGLQFVGKAPGKILVPPKCEHLVAVSHLAGTDITQTDIAALRQAGQRAFQVDLAARRSGLPGHAGISIRKQVPVT